MWNLRRIFSMGAPKSQFLERVLEKLKRKAISGPGTLLHKGSQEIMEKQRIPCLAKQHDDTRSWAFLNWCRNVHFVFVFLHQELDISIICCSCHHYHSSFSSSSLTFWGSIYGVYWHYCLTVEGGELLIIRDFCFRFCSKKIIKTN